MSASEPSDTVNAGMAIQTEGRRAKRKSPPSDLWLVGWLVVFKLLKSAVGILARFNVITSLSFDMVVLSLCSV